MKQELGDVYVLDGKADISNLNKENTNLTFEIQNVTENTKLELPYIFYLGYNAKLTTNDGTKTSLEIQESNNGFCQITVSNIDKGTITISYKGTTLMCLSYILSILGLVGILYFSLKKST